jgi:hypothetical protein
MLATAVPLPLCAAATGAILTQLQQHTAGVARDHEAFEAECAGRSATVNDPKDSAQATSNGPGTVGCNESKAAAPTCKTCTLPTWSGQGVSATLRLTWPCLNCQCFDRGDSANTPHVTAKGCEHLTVQVERMHVMLQNTIVDTRQRLQVASAAPVVCYSFTPAAGLLYLAHHCRPLRRAAVNQSIGRTAAGRTRGGQRGIQSNGQVAHGEEARACAQLTVLHSHCSPPTRLLCLCRVSALQQQLAAALQHPAAALLDSTANWVVADKAAALCVPDGSEGE